jgi:hypothetical protein
LVFFLQFHNILSDRIAPAKQKALPDDPAGQNYPYDQ